MKYSKVIINSVTVKDSSAADPKKIIRWEYTKDSDAITEAEIEAILTIRNLVELSAGQVVELWGGNTTSTDQRFFYGKIDSIKPEGSKFIIKCSNEMIDLVRKNVNKVYDSSIDASAGEVSEIVEDLITTYGGLTASVQASGTADGEKIDEFKCINTDVYERVVALRKALNWDLYYDDATRVVHFEPLGFVSSGKTLNVKSEILGIPDWNIDTSEMINDLRVDGATIETTITESGQIGVTSGYTTADILLTKTPNSAELLIDASNPPTTQREGGSKDASSSGFFYIDRENKKLKPATGTTFTTNHYSIINYIWSSPAPIHMVNQASKDTYGAFQKTVEFSDITSVADAESRALNILNRRSVPFVSGTMRVKLTDVPNRAETVDIVDTITPTVSGNPLSGTYVVNSVKYQFPSPFEVIEVGDKNIRLADWQQNTEERLKRLEEQFVRNQDIILELVNIQNDIQVEPRYRQIQTRDVSADYFWGGGNWATQYWDGTYTESEVDHWIGQYEDTYTEDFIDTDFKATATTASGWT